MSQMSVLSRKLSHSSGRKRFLDRILRKRLLLTSTTTSSSALKISKSTDSDTTAVHNLLASRLLTSLAHGSLDSEAFSDEDVNLIYDHDSVTELEHPDVLLDPNAELFSNESVERFADSNKQVEFPLITAAVTNQDESTLPWAGLTYEALVFPKYIKVNRKSNKSPRLLNNLFLAQELRCAPAENDEKEESDDDASIPNTSDSILDGTSQPMNPNELLVMEFSRDGKYLAVAGRDARIYVWQVISSPLSKLQYRNNQSKNPDEKDPEKCGSKKSVYRCAPVFHGEPVKVFEGHTSTILTLDWSKNNFLISGSMDRTVRLWNVDRPDCLEVFQHEDFVTAVAFHPTDDRFFTSGSLDNCVRLWSVLESSVAYVNNLGDDVLITAIALTPPGNHIVVGGFNGSLFALETNGLHCVHRVEIKENSIAHPFHHKLNNKITGIRVFENPAAKDLAQKDLLKWNILVTTNDSKVRLIDLRLKKLVTRFKGSSNSSSSIVASLSSDDRFIISGSEDHWCYVWENNNSIINNKLRAAMRDFYVDGKSHVSEKHKKMSKLFLETKLWKKLNVQHFLEGNDGNNYVANENHSYSAFHAHHGKVNVALFAPETTKKLLEFSDDIIYDLVKREPSLNKAGLVTTRDKNSNQAQSTGLDCGHIIVTCDKTGLIRVFRQDSAYYVRKRLIEFRKSIKITKSPDMGDLTSVMSNNRKIDICGLSRKLSKTRSISPTIDRSGSFKTKFQNKLKPTVRAGTATSSSSMIPPRLQLSKSTTLVPESPDNRPNIVSSSSQVNLKEASKGAFRGNQHLENGVTVPLRDEDSHSISDESITFSFPIQDVSATTTSGYNLSAKNGRPIGASTEYLHDSISTVVEQGLKEATPS